MYDGRNFFFAGMDLHLVAVFHARKSGLSVCLIAGFQGMYRRNSLWMYFFCLFLCQVVAEDQQGEALGALNGIKALVWQFIK